MPNLNDAKLMEEGFPHYHETCRLCHEGPGYLPAEFAEGLYPHPPGMTAGHLQEALSDAEIYWIVKHGLTMTGMPTFGPTHDEEQLRGIVAIVEEIPRMSPEQYRQLVIKLTNPGSGKSHGHSHGTTEEEKVHKRIYSGSVNFAGPGINGYVQEAKAALKTSLKTVPPDWAHCASL